MLAGGALVSRSIVYLPASPIIILIGFVLMSCRLLLAVLMRCFPVQDDLLSAKKCVWDRHPGRLCRGGNLQRRSAYPLG